VKDLRYVLIHLLSTRVNINFVGETVAGLYHYHISCSLADIAVTLRVKKKERKKERKKESSSTEYLVATPSISNDKTFWLF
jgi:hypothetical protein